MSFENDVEAQVEPKGSSLFPPTKQKPEGSIQTMGRQGIAVVLLLTHRTSHQKIQASVFGGNTCSKGLIDIDSNFDLFVIN